MSTPKPADLAISDGLVAAVSGRLADNKRVRRTLPGGGRIHIDRQLPFLCVHRPPAEEVDDGMRPLVTSEASYLIAPALKGLHPSLTSLVSAVVRTLTAEFGGFLILELSVGTFPPGERSAESDQLTPAFRVIAPKTDELDEFVDHVGETMRHVTVRKQTATVDVRRAGRMAPAGLPPLVRATPDVDSAATVIGVEVKPIFRDRRNGRMYPLILRELEREVTRALRQIFFDFAQRHTTHRPRHYHGLGRRAFVKAVWTVDERLAEISNSFDFLLHVTPTNTKHAWRQFHKHQFARPPVFRYRPLPVDPVLLKRRLFRIPLERLEDPALRHIFREKQDELDRRLTMLLDINTPRFIYGSLQIYGPVEDDLVATAKHMLNVLPSRTRDDSTGGQITAAAFAERAKAELAYYRERWPQMNGKVHIRDDVTGLMVSRGSLLVSSQSRIPEARVHALLQHEVGTHMVTYYNGRAQPFRQLASGLAGYEALQEGLAVLAEYLVGGLSRPRLRLLAARVVAARYLVDGASFADTFRELDRTYDFEQQTAFAITTRVYRGGGLTKDAVYLKGFLELLEYLRQGGDLELLFVGKLAPPHLPVVHELLWRRVLKPAPLRPRYLEHPDAVRRLAGVQAGLTISDIIPRKPRR